ncbi:transcriptional regulator [Chryseobacterium piperi]|uniref:Transcriptional regulator n=1 Tax=Chryseobacterium piperi TaxID=558152 RepID=A0A086BJZ6_9FLAO|nr:LacI family DNA-binding transcriptional regulator [Chryseobacterium piperi]ASW73816.1 LacI family transcriptional regulator [Chryseobacterium piperi]KFF29260.1 transcriptional regulator [Chryseobacterium piperi]
MKRASIKDIARIAGVSVATVSYVLNKKEGSRISESTKDKILKIAEEIHYTPNKIARSLKMSNSKLIGLIVPDISNDFYSNIARCIENEAMKLGYTILIGSSDENADKFGKLTELFSGQQVDGMIVTPVTGSDDAVKRLLRDEYPVVSIDYYLKDIDLPAVTLNNFEISEQVFDYFIKHDVEELIYIGYKTDLPHLLDRQYGFERKISEMGLTSTKILVEMGEVSDEVHAELKKHFKITSRKTALYFLNNKIAIAGLHYLVKNKIRVPEDVSVIAFDGIDAYSLFPTEITYIRQPLEEMAVQAIKLLDGQIKNFSDEAEKAVCPAELVIRKSVK